MNKFIWTDLSTYSLKESVEFYSALLGWTFTNDRGYYVGGDNGNYTVGIYETPEFFQKINMPHFWMNYVSVESLKETTKRAVELAAKIELNDVSFYGGQIALIRDPMGAGFTVYEGKALLENSNEESCLGISRKLHTSNAKVNIGFYENLFNWQITLQGDAQYTIKDINDDPIGSLLEVHNDIKGKYEYWVTQFKVKNLDEVIKRLVSLGGKEIINEGSRIMVTDKFGEAFLYLSS